MSRIRFWYAGFRLGIRSYEYAPIGAVSAHNQLHRAYYAGYNFGVTLGRSFRR